MWGSPRIFNQADAGDFFGAQFANLQEMRGCFGDLVPVLEETVRRLPALPNYRAVLINACADAGEVDRARDMLDAEREVGFVMPANSTWLNAHMQWAKAAISVGDRDTGAVMLERLAPLRDQLVFTGLTVSPVAGHYVGRLEHLLGRLDDADASFARAHQVHQRLRAAQFVARTEVRWAQMLCDRNRSGDLARARDLARTAGVASDGRSGWEWIARDVRAISTARADRRHPVGLVVARAGSQVQIRPCVQPGLRAGRKAYGERMSATEARVVLHHDLAELALAELRGATGNLPAVAVYLLQMIGLVVDAASVNGGGDRVGAFREQARLIVDTVDAGDALEADRRRVQDTFDDLFRTR